MVLNPANKFHGYNSSRPSEFKLPSPPRQAQDPDDLNSHEEAYACVNDGPYSKGWLVDLINRFGHHGGFAKLADRFSADNMATLTVPLIHALVSSTMKIGAFVS